MNKEKLDEIIENHRKWLLNEEGGSRADLSRANLSRANLSRADLSRADLSRANLSRADLSRANLIDANLCRANLIDANLWGTTGNLNQLKSIFLEIYQITYTAEILQIGCRKHKITEWWEFSDDQISEMDSNASEFWRKWKMILKEIIEMSPASL